MKTLRRILGTLLLLLTVTACQGQTPEQQRQIAEAEKMAAEAQRISDSIMNSPETKKRVAEAEKMMDSLNNSPQIQAFFEQMEEMDAQNEKNRVQRKEQEKALQQETTTQKRDDQGHLKHLKITSGNSKKFDDWSLGTADITISTHRYKGGDAFDKRTIGQINSDGGFTITLPESMNVQIDGPPITNYFKTSSDPHGTNDNETRYTGEDTHIGKASIRIGGSNEDLGSLYLATSRQLVWNNSPAGMYRGDPGYRISVWYANGPATVKANTTSMARDTDHAEIVKNIPMTQAYDLTFKPGLNFIKEEVVGTQYVGNVPYYKTMRYTTLGQLPKDVKWVYSKY